MDLEKKIAQLTEDVSLLKRQLREGTKVSDDSRKAIIHDVYQHEREHRNRRLVAIATVLTVIVSLISYVGYTSLQQAISSELAKSKIKESVVKELLEEKKQLNKETEKLKSVISDIKLANNRLNESYNKMKGNLDVREEKIHRLLKILLKREVDYSSIDSLIDPNFMLISDSLEELNFIRAFGIDDKFLIIFLSAYVDDFTPSKVTNSSLHSAILKAQEQFGLTTDGQLGPCSSLVFSSLIYADYPLRISDNLKNSIFVDQSWLGSAFQACSLQDKEIIGRYLDYTDLPLNKELNSFVQAAGIDRSVLIDSLNMFKVDSNGYKALDSIGVHSR